MRRKEQWKIRSAQRRPTMCCVHAGTYVLLAVESVYGVAVAGAKCRDMQPNRFAVVLMHMSLPTKIGGKLKIDKYAIGESFNNCGLLVPKKTPREC